MDRIVDEYKRIKKEHRQSIKNRAARIVPGASVIRVFAPGTKNTLIPALEAVDIDKLLELDGSEEFKMWFEKDLNHVAAVIKKNNPNNTRIYPGYKWGHTTKVLTLYVREVVLCSRYFTDAQVRRISPWLYIPIDSIAITRLKKLGCKPPFSSIKQIDTAGKFYDIQNMLSDAANHVGVPRIWFDDVWGDRA